MKLYATPGGTWAGTEKDWANALKAEGLNPKLYDGRKIIDVPTSKAELLEFLTFHSVNVVNPIPVIPYAQPTTVPNTAAPQSNADRPPGAGADMLDLDQAFAKAPIQHQLRLAVFAIDGASGRLTIGHQD